MRLCRFNVVRPQNRLRNSSYSPSGIGHQKRKVVKSNGYMRYNGYNQKRIQINEKFEMRNISDMNCIYKRKEFNHRKTEAL